MATKASKGFEVTCPFCSDPDATISLDVNDVHKLTCSACDQEFSAAAAVAKAAEALRRWEALARWIDSAEALTAAPK